MEWIAGFIIATLVALTGIGGGSFTVPLLVLIGMPAPEAVGTAMIFAAILRLTIAPVYIMRRQIHAKYLRLLLLGAVPGLLAGTFGLHFMNRVSGGPFILLVVGIMLTISSSIGFVPRLRKPVFARENGGWLTALAFPIGLESGFSSAGAGSLGTILLLNFSELSVSEVVGTDILFGIVLALVGSAFHMGWGSVNFSILMHLLCGGIPGALVGCFLAKRVPGHRLRALAALIAIVLGLQLVWTSGHTIFRVHERVQRSSPVSSGSQAEKGKTKSIADTVDR